ncbi:restriction endonuclease subunit S [Pseudoalteromonas arctica]|uniref:Restriction endonuclease subunit S n=1 Tax=Pseudoalteromonas arctica TaxID=394751 RepID=A0ABU9TLJ7_9GAMM
MALQEEIKLPKGWGCTTLIELAKFIDYRGRTPKKTESGIPLITAKNIRQGYIDRNPREFIAFDAYDDWMTRGIPKVGDVLLTTEAPLGNVAIIDIEEKFALAQRAICFQFYEAYVGKFISYFLRSPQFQQILDGNSTGTTVKGIKAATLKKLAVNTPPLPEQKRIVEKLDSLLAQVDTIQQRLNNLPDIIKRFRQSVLAAAVSGKLTEQWRVDNSKDLLSLTEYKKLTLDLYNSKKKADKSRIEKIKAKEWFYSSKGFIPAGWVDSHLIDITSVITCGVAKKPNYIDEGIKFLSAQNAKPFAPNLNKIKYISQEDFETFTVGAQPEKNDVLYSRVGANFGEACVIPWDFDFAIYVSLTLIKPYRNLIDEHYLTMFLNSKDGVLQSRGGIMGSGIQNLNVENVRKYKVPLPSLREQSEIVRLVEQYFALADTLEKNLANAKQRVDNLTQSILAKAFRGELVPQNPNDEPADKLLARIKAARLEAEMLEKAAKKAAKASKK